MKFCHHCGKQVIDGSRFCPHCGTNLSSLTSVPETKTQKAAASTTTFTPFRPHERDEEDHDIIDSVESLEQLGIDPRRMRGLEIEISRDRPQGETIGAIASQGAMGLPSTIDKREGLPQTDNKTFLEQFRKEAGTLRGGNSRNKDD